MQVISRSDECVFLVPCFLVPCLCGLRKCHQEVSILLRIDKKETDFFFT